MKINNTSKRRFLVFLMVLPGLLALQSMTNASDLEFLGFSITIFVIAYHLFE